LYQWGNVLLSQTDWAQAEQKFRGAYDLWHGQGQTQNAMLALAGLAYAAYQQEILTTAAAHAEQLWQTLQESPALAERVDLKVYWMLGMVWQGLGDSRTDNLWKEARTLLQQRSEKFSNEAARQMFLEEVPARRAILKS
jgi:outer membrane protein assembly factor BamD (BamD/ComL family)